MTTKLRSNLGLILCGAALAIAGYLAGGSQPTSHAADDVKTDEAASTGGMLGVAIPNGGAAVVKGKDGFAYVVDARGVYVRAAQSGKPLPLP